MKRLMMIGAVLMVTFVAGARLPDVLEAQGTPAPRAGGANPNAGRGQAPNGRFTDEPRAARNMFLLTAGPETRAQPGKARLYTNEFQNAQKTHYEWAPEYRLTATTRPAAAVGQEPTTGELHTDNTQIYLVTGGSGTVVVEGTVAPENTWLVAPGEQRGGPITGGRKVKVKPGDMLSIPPLTWHVGYGDPGVALTYTIIHIHTRQTIP
jgi:mannose-6-phosphate isomerase-like protein (cupin superfamily)